VSIGGGRAPVWSHDGRELFYRAGDGMMMAATIVDGPRAKVSDRAALFSAADYWDSQFLGHDVAPDGRFLMIRTLARESGVEAPPPPQINVVLNWFEELEERVPN
jgi:hypothetical protein